MDILNCGSLNIDFVYKVDEFLRPGETKLSQSLDFFCGGKGLNQSIAAARAGNRVYHAGLLGEDGKMLRDKLEENGVMLDYLTPVSGKSGHAMIQVDKRGQNCILLYGGTNQALTKEYIDSVLDKFDSNTLMLIQNELNLTDYIIEKAYSRGIPVAMNAAPMDDKVLSYPIEKLSWLIVNEIEGCALAECDSDEDILGILGKKYPNCSVLLTLGHRGSKCLHKGKITTCGACRVKPVDTTAAGDTFTGYFLHGILNGKSVAESQQLATVASAICVQREGASDSVPFKAEVDEVLAKGVYGVPEIQ